ncbi:hypothetical protein NRM5_005620 [Chlamydia psittaci]|nr:hypothetical protein NRM5_005620 [Chlamydia psittaci]
MPISIRTEDKTIVVVLSKFRPLRKKIAAKMAIIVEEPKTINIVSRNNLRDEQRCDGFLFASLRLIVEGNEESILLFVGTGFDMPNP